MGLHDILPPSARSQKNWPVWGIVSRAISLRLLAFSVSRLTTLLRPQAKLSATSKPKNYFMFHTTARLAAGVVVGFRPAAGVPRGGVEELFQVC